MLSSPQGQKVQENLENLVMLEFAGKKKRKRKKKK